METKEGRFREQAKLIRNQIIGSDPLSSDPAGNFAGKTNLGLGPLNGKQEGLSLPWIAMVRGRFRNSPQRVSGDQGRLPANVRTWLRIRVQIGGLLKGKDRDGC